MERVQFTSSVNLGKRKFALFILIIISLSLIPRVVNLSESLLNIQPFRQTQTAITVWMFSEEGFSPLNYSTPIFGPPYQVPFEFPFYQATAFGIYKLGVGSIEVACRLTNLLYYILTCAVLLLIGTHVFRSALAVLVMLVHFCATPFAICWSRSVSIEYCALFLSLTFMALVYKQVNSSGHHKWIFGFFACIIGIFAFTTKLTTAFPYAIVAFAIFSGKHWPVLLDVLRQGGRPRLLHVKESLKVMVDAAVMFGVPFVVMYLWVRHTDLVKMQSSFSYIATSSSLATWNFGTLSAKLSANNWSVIMERIFYSIIPISLILMAVVSLVIIKNPRKLIYCLVLFGLALIPMLVFFNLYLQHDYYLVAVLPFFSVIFSISLISLFRSVNGYSKWIRLILWPCITILIGFPFLTDKGIDINSQYLRHIHSPEVLESHPQIKIGELIQKMTHSSDPVIITDFQWSSEVLFYAKRKGLMWTLNNEKNMQRYANDLGKENYRLIVSKNPENYPNLISNFNVIDARYADGHHYLLLR